MSQYSSLSRAQLSYDYLHTNSTTHEFLFGALAELIDNARDASATKINFYTVANKELRGGFMLCCVDDGHGMDSGESADIVTFGKSRKKSMDSQMIGMYGNGLKSGSMRISNDLVMFTKCGQEMTCVFLSRSFHEIENIDEIIVPMPVFDVLTKKPNCKNANDKKKHQLEMSIILKYSPFKTEADFMREFDRIEGNSGTLIIMYNMKLLDTGEPELDIKSVEHDILLSNPDGDDYDTDEGLMPERRSFRAYTSILYVDPRMRIYIQSKKVQTKRLASSLYKPRMYRYSSNRFKARSEQDSRRALEESKIADNRAREAESKARNLENKLGERGSKEKRAELRKMQTTAIDYRKDAQIKKQMADRKSRATRGPKTLTFTFGINLEHRGQDGMFVYNCSRLIKMYQKVGPQIEGGIYCSGVVGIVDVPYLVLEPTHNKQDFADAKEYRHLQKAMGEHMVQYWKDVGIGGQGVAKFWETYGYTTSAWTAKASTETKYIRKRAMQIQTTIQCNLCLKWRILPFSSSTVGKEYADDWTCSLNPDPTHNRCSSSEQKLNIPERVLRKEVKTAEQKKEDLELEIKKKKEALTKLQKNKPTPRRGRQASSSSSESSESESSSEEEPPPPKKNRPSLSSSKTQSTSSSKRSGSSTPAQNTSNNRRSLNNSTSKNTSSSRTPVPIKSTPTPSSRSSSRTHTPASTTKPSTTPVSTPKQPIGPASSNRRRIAVASDSSDSDEEESSTVKEPPAKKKTLSPPAAKMTPRSQSESDTETTTSRSNNASNKTEFLASRTENDTETPKKPIHVTESDIGREVECKIGAKWFKGTVIEVNPRLSKWKVKFDIYPTDKHDRWYAVDSSDIKHDKTALSEAELPDIGINDSLDELESVVPVVTEPSQPDTQSNDKSPPTSKNNLPTENLDKPEQPTEDAPQQDEPSSSTPAAVNNVTTPNNGTANDVPVTSAAASSSSNPTANNQYNDEIANGYRTCLRYFLPPQWIMDKDSVSTLSLQELVAFPLDDFFDHYEKGLRKLVGSFQYEAQVKQQECDTTQKKLSDVRKLIAKLLKSINEEFDIDPEADTEQVDELLAACVKQATTQ